MVKIESLGCELVDIRTNIVPIFIKRFQSVEHKLEIQHRSLRVQVIDLNIGQELNLIGFGKFFSQDFSNSDPYISQKIPERNEARPVTLLQCG